MKEGGDFILTPPAFPKIRTTFDAFQQAVKAHPEKPYLGTRKIINKKSDPVELGEFEWKSYKDVEKAVHQFGTGLMTFDPGEYIGLYARNSEKWVMVMHAAAGYSVATAAMYDTLGAEALTHCMNMTDMRVVFVQDDNVDKVIAAASEVSSLKYVITEGKVKEDMRSEAEDAGLEIFSFDDVCKLGRKTSKYSPPKPDDVNTVCFTSGTTGMPKGAVLTHKNMVSGLAALSVSRPMRSGEEVHLSYLPLAHIMERNVNAMVTMYGGAIGFFGGDIKRLPEDIKALRPTLFVSVPRLLNRVYDKIIGTARDAGGCKQCLFNCALKAKLANLERGACSPGICCWPCGCCCCAPMKTHWFWDALVFKKVQKGLGGRVNLIVSGSAPLDQQVLRFFRAAFACEVLEGYGQSEGTAIATIQLPSDPTTGHVGHVLPANEIALQSVPDMNYYVEGAKLRKGTKKEDVTVGGEICQRGANIMTGYLHDDDKTREAIDEDGWLHTGDIGIWLPGGQLKIVDRKKALFKLSHGEYIAPEKVESVYQHSSFVNQCWVYGESTKPFLVAVVVVDPEGVKKWSRESGVTVDAKHPNKCKELRKAVLDDFTTLGKEVGPNGVANLRGFEIVQAVYLEAKEWTTEDMLTPTNKLKRSDLKNKYKDELEVLLAEAAKNEKA